MSTFAKFLLPLLPLLACLAPLHGQSADISLKIDLVAWGDEIGGLSLKPGKKEGAITALAFQYSAPVNYTGPPLMEVYKNGEGSVKPKPAPSAEDLKQLSQPLLPEPAEPGKAAPPTSRLAAELQKRREKKPTLVALAEIPTNSNRATVLLAPAGDGTFIAYVIDDDPTKLPVGKLRIHNLSPYPIAMRIDHGTAKELPPRGAIVVPVTDEQISYDLSYKLGDEWKFQEHNFQQIFAKDQTQMVLLKSANSHFLSSDGSSGGFLQAVTLRREPAR
jgi:hypothetical protein